MNSCVANVLLSHYAMITFDVFAGNHHFNYKVVGFIIKCLIGLIIPILASFSANFVKFMHDRDGLGRCEPTERDEEEAQPKREALLIRLPPWESKMDLIPFSPKLSLINLSPGSKVTIEASKARSPQRSRRSSKKSVYSPAHNYFKHFTDFNHPRISLLDENYPTQSESEIVTSTRTGALTDFIILESSKQYPYDPDPREVSLPPTNKIQPNKPPNEIPLELFSLNHQILLQPGFLLIEANSKLFTQSSPSLRLHSQNQYNLLTKTQPQAPRKPLTRGQLRNILHIVLYL